jgi:hypothetical protein
MQLQTQAQCIVTGDSSENQARNEPTGTTITVVFMTQRSCTTHHFQVDSFATEHASTQTDIPVNERRERVFSDNDSDVTSFIEVKDPSSTLFYCTFSVSLAVDTIE